MHNGESGAVDAEDNEEARQLRDSLRVLAAEKETLSLNIDKVSTERGRLREDKTTLTGWVAELIEWVTALTNELAQEKLEIDIKNAHIVALEEVKVANDVNIRFQRLLVRSLLAQAAIRNKELEMVRVSEIKETEILAAVLRINMVKILRMVGYCNCLQRRQKRYIICH